MADTKISALPASTTPLTGSELVPIVQGGVTKQVTINNLTSGRQIAVGGMYTTGAVYINSSGNLYAEILRVSGNYSVYDNATFTGFIGCGTNIGVGGNTDFSFRSQAGMAFGVGGTTLALQFSSTANVTFNTGNLIQGTAAKGINFTANSAAAGMTSQLLNWYEEGTWTPNQGAGLTVVGAFSSSGTYTRVGRQITVRGSVSGATSVAIAGTASQICTNLPYNSNGGHSGTMFNNALGVTGGVASSAAILYAVSTIAATPTITFTITYQI